MGAGHAKHAATAQHVLGQPLRPGNVVEPFVEHVLDRRIAARQRVADHDLLAVVADRIRRIAFAQRDAQLFELGGHRRIDVLVAAFDLVTGLARQRRHAAHEGAADTEDVEFHPRHPAQGCAVGQ